MQYKKTIQKLLIKISKILIIVAPFFIYDFYLRYLAYNLNHIKPLTNITPILFNISYAILAYLIFILLKKKGQLIFYNLTFAITTILFIAQTLHFKILNRFFGLSDIFLAGEGADYFLYALTRISLIAVLLVTINIIIVIFGNKIIKQYQAKPKLKKKIIITLCCFIAFRLLAILSLGHASINSSWEASYLPKNIYQDFNNQNKNMEIVGLYEQTFRNSYLYIKDYFDNYDDIHNELREEDLDIIHQDNAYTSLIEGKNVIFILLESIDSWLVNEEVMPTLTKLANEGLNFTNRYAPVFGGGATINSEFAANTGMYSVDSAKAIYNYDLNYYPYSLANMLKKEGYNVNSIHENNGKYYNRSLFHRALGYETHYALKDLPYLGQNYDYEFDTSLIKDENVASLIIQEEPFLSFVITYSNHLPYNSSNKICQDNNYNLNVKDDESLSCIRNLARETDEFLKLLIEELANKDILDNTALVLFTDHYTYGYPDLEFVYEEKNVEDSNMASNVPFIIWSPDIEHEDIDILMDTKDITPTVLNLLGIPFQENYYIGNDVFSPNHDNFVYFSSESFYDGNLYYHDKNQINEENRSYIIETLQKIQAKITRNDNIIKSNYFQYK